MSGIITGPYFLSFFKDPTEFALGTMVAILEIGALRMFLSIACALHQLKDL